MTRAKRVGVTGSTSMATYLRRVRPMQRGVSIHDVEPSTDGEASVVMCDAAARTLIQIAWRTRAVCKGGTVGVSAYACMRVPAVRVPVPTGQWPTTLGRTRVAAGIVIGGAVLGTIAACTATKPSRAVAAAGSLVGGLVALIVAGKYVL